MIALKKILFALDFSGVSSKALGHAVMLADRFRAQLTLLHVKTSEKSLRAEAEELFPDMTRDPGILMDEIQREFSMLLAEEDAKSLHLVHAVLEGSSPAEEISKYAKEHEIDLIVMATHGRTGLEHFFLGSVAETVVRTAPCPVLTVRLRLENEVEPYFNITVPVDFSDHSTKALRYGIALARQFDAKLDLLHVLDFPVMPDYYGKKQEVPLGPPGELHLRTQDMLRQLMLDNKAAEMPYQIHVLEGRSYNVISKFVETNQSDLMIIGTHGLSGLSHFLLGSTAAKIVRHATCPVLTVKFLARDFVT